ncbi:MAG TPA: hypothetical protein PKY82_22930, partial [Pyrinomonadaceae bacterium]|nr:hypothetical protein [Pyrinomonadaceae bacterium]
MEIRDAAGTLVRTFSSQADKTFRRYDGGPSPEPTLSKSKGLNRFVWDMRYSTMPGVPGVYIEASYAGHKAIPGKYSITINANGQKVSTEAEILVNPLYPTTPAVYKEYNSLMSQMETELTTMHKMVNSLYEKQKQLDGLISSLPDNEKFGAIKKDGEALLKKMKAWDEDMVQRKSKAYDDVDNFLNKFSANYLYLINQTESDIPRVNQPNLDLLKQYTAEWTTLKARGNEMLDKDIPAINKRLWDAGKGAIWKD